MSEVISFPGLGLSFEISRVAFSIGGYNIYWYGITFALGFLVGMWYFHLRARALGIHPYDGLDVLLWAVIGGVAGARIYFVIFQWDMYKDNLIKIFAFREGGLAIYGGVIGSMLVGWIVCRMKKTPFLPVLDGGLTGLLLAQAIGRWGNFFNCEVFGGNTTLPWGMTSNTISRYLFNMADTLAAQGMTVDPTVPVHPTFFYEFLWNLAGFLLLAFVLTPRRKYDGQVSLGYMAWYGLGRFFIEGLRTDSLMLGQFRVSQLLSLLLFVGSVGAMVILYFRHRENPAVLYVDTEESKARMAQADAEMNGTAAQQPGETAEASGEGSEEAAAEETEETAETAESAEDTGETVESAEDTGETNEVPDAAETADVPEVTAEAEEVPENTVEMDQDPAAENTGETLVSMLEDALLEEDAEKKNDGQQG